MSTPLRLVAHRGLWWPRRERQNHPDGFADALARGWGVELDLLAYPQAMGGWVVAHPGDAHLSALWAVLKALEAGDGPILWNVKSRDSEDVLRDVFAGPLGARSWIFDHDYEATDPELPQRFPDGRYLWRDTMPDWRWGTYGGDHDGWWLDGVGEANAALLTQDAQPCFVVSPELHGRPLDLAFARRVLDAGAWLCTDQPALIEALYTNPALEPVGTWWAP